MTKPIIYSFRRCPYAMRARMAIAHAGRDVTLREILLRDKPAAMLAASPKASVPVLVLPDGTVIDESLDIMRWAVVDMPLIASAEWDLIALFDDTFKYHLDRYKYASRYENADAHAHRTAAHDILRDLEPRLHHKSWLNGADYGFTDLAILPFIRQFRIADMAWFDAELALPQIANWLSGFLDLPLFLGVMQKYPIWQDTGEEVDFP